MIYIEIENFMIEYLCWKYEWKIDIWNWVPSWLQEFSFINYKFYNIEIDLY